MVKKKQNDLYNEGEARRQVENKMKEKATKKVIVNALRVIGAKAVGILIVTLISIAIIIPIVAWFVSIFDSEEKDTDLERVVTDTYLMEGGISPFGCKVGSEKFYEDVKKCRDPEDFIEYKDSEDPDLRARYTNAVLYQEKMVSKWYEFYEICLFNNINPCYAWAHACIETGFGTSPDCVDRNNWFGYGHTNTASEGKEYPTPEDSIKEYCEWLVEAATEGTKRYNTSLEAVTTIGER